MERAVVETESAQSRAAVCENIAAGLDVVTTVDEFHDLCEPLGLYRSERFIHLEMDIVNKCNLRCVMCYHSLETTRRKKTVRMTPAQFTAIASSVLPHANFLSLSLGNEPLMSPHFAQILDAAAEFGVPNINFFTNGLLLDDAKIDAIIACGVTQVCVSIDGATAETYNGIRRGGDFDDLTGNVKQLISRREASRSPTPRVRFDFVMMRRNIEEIEDLVRLAHELGVDALNFSHLISFEGLDMDGDSLSRHPALSNHWLNRAIDTAHELDIEVQFQPAAFELPPAAKTQSPPAGRYPLRRLNSLAHAGRAMASLVRHRWKSRTNGVRVAEADPPQTSSVPGTIPPGYCPYPFFHVSMGPEGHVLPCPYSHGEDPFGVMNRDLTFEEIWFGPDFTRLRRRILSADPPQMCCRCPYLANRHPDLTELFATREQSSQTEVVLS